MRFSDEQGRVNMDEVHDYVKTTIPQRADWEALKGRMVDEGLPIRFLARAQVQVDVRTGEGLFSLPDLGFPQRKYEAVIDRPVVRAKRDHLLQSAETWGVVELEWRLERVGNSQEEGHVFMVGFDAFQPYDVDPVFFSDARSEFTLEEWIDQLLMAVDYNPAGFITLGEKLTMLARLLPFVEKRLNLIELAPKGTGKSYMFSQISKYGWLVSGGSISRARMFHNIQSNQPGLVSRHDYVALDEVQTITFTNDEEMRGALKGYMESGEYRIGEHHGVGEAGIVLLGNIDHENMRVDRVMFRELPPSFQESALIDRFHGFIKGWNIPRMRENMKAEGWGLNTEYMSEILHGLRGDVRYRSTVEDLIHVPRGSDTRDTEAVRRMATAWLKLLFPHATSPEMVNRDEFRRYCLGPAMEMRGTIRQQLHRMDSEYSDAMPGITC
jgi:ATP-dependent Lon protease